ncbi:MAG: hypothetical protein ABIE22_04080 [archaeon]
MKFIKVSNYHSARARILQIGKIDREGFVVPKYSPKNYPHYPGCWHNNKPYRPLEAVQITREGNGSGLITLVLPTRLLEKNQGESFKNYQQRILKIAEQVNQTGKK